MASQHQSAYNAAIDAGDWDAARQIKVFLDEDQAAAVEAPQETMGYNDAESWNPENLVESAGNRVKGFADGAGEFIESGGNTLESLTQGVREAGMALQGRSLNREGQTPDALDEAIANNKARMAAQPDSWQKTAGTIAGYGVAGAPLAIASSPLVAGGGFARAGLVAGMESGLFSGLTTRGDLGERSKTAAIDTVVGGGIGAVAKPVSNYVQRRFTSAGAGAPEGRSVQDELDRARGDHMRVPDTAHGKIMQDGKPHDGSPVRTPNIEGKSTAGTQRIDDAYANGDGFRLDRVDAEAASYAPENLPPLRGPDGEPQSASNWELVNDKPNALVEAANLKGDAIRANTNSYDGFRERQHRDITKQGYGQVDEGLRGNTAGAAKERTSNEAVSTLNDIKLRDEQAVKDAYAATADRLGGDTKLTTGDPMSNKIKLLGETIGEGDSGARRKVAILLDKYGLSGKPRGAPKTKTNALGDEVSRGVDQTSRKDQLSLDDYQALRKELTSLYEQGNPNLNRQIEEIKGVLDEGVANSARATGSLEDELVNEMVEATRLSREANLKWNDKTSAGKLVKAGEDTDFATAAYKKIDTAITSGHVERVANLRKAAEGDPAATKALEDAFEARKLAIIEKYTQDGRVNGKGLHKAVEDITPEMRVELWGQEGADALTKFARSVKLLDSAEGGGNMGVLGDKFLQRLGNMGSAKYGAGTVRAMNTGLKAFSKAGELDILKQNASRLYNDQLPAPARDKLVDDAMKRIMSEIDADVVGGETYNMLRAILRNGLMGYMESDDSPN